MALGVYLSGKIDPILKAFAFVSLHIPHTLCKCQKNLNCDNVFFDPSNPALDANLLNSKPDSEYVLNWVSEGYDVNVLQLPPEMDSNLSV